MFVNQVIRSKGVAAEECSARGCAEWWGQWRGRP